VACLKDVLDQVLGGSTDYHSMRADVWKQAHPDFIRTYRVDERRLASGSAASSAALNG
jgi:hypothetical protein